MCTEATTNRAKDLVEVKIRHTKAKLARYKTELVELEDELERVSERPVGSGWELRDVGDELQLIRTLRDDPRKFRYVATINKHGILLEDGSSDALEGIATFSTNRIKLRTL